MSKYPKKFMRLSELTALGLSPTMLRNIARSRHQNIACKMDPTKRNSPLIFDTDELEKYRRAQCTGV